MNGKKIYAVEYTYTLKNTDLNGTEFPVFLYSDPTITIKYWSFFSKITITMEVKMYDEQGNIIDTTGALLDFQSLNRGHGYSQYNGRDAIEKVSYYTGEALEINGSSVKAHGTELYADGSNFVKVHGSRFDSREWDSTTSPLNWYGAIVGKQTQPNIKFDMSSEYCVNVWFGFDSKIKAKNVPVKPIAPTPPIEPQKPNTKVKYHYNMLFFQPPVEKKVNDQNDIDINNHAVLKDSTVKFALNAADLPAGHEKINSLKFTDKLPTGYKADLMGTKQASPNYNVIYDDGTNEITFSAKPDYLNTLNANLNVEAKITAPVIIGTVTKEGSSYKNDFTLNVNNVYSVKSKPVTVYTSTKPKKDVFKGNDITSIDGKLVNAGDELRYEITYKNTTGSKQKVTVTDKIPAHTKFVSAENGGTESGGVVKWTVNVADGDTFKVRFTVKVDKNIDGKMLTNTAVVNDGVADFNTNTVKNPTPKITGNPNTVDSNNIMLLIIMLLASSGIFVSATAFQRKRER